MPDPLSSFLIPVSRVLNERTDHAIARQDFDYAQAAHNETQRRAAENAIALQNVREAGDDRRLNVSNAAAMARLKASLKMQYDKLDEAEANRQALQLQRAGARPPRAGESTRDYLVNAHTELVATKATVLNDYDKRLAAHESAVQGHVGEQQRLAQQEEGRIRQQATILARNGLIEELTAGTAGLFSEKIPGSKAALALIASRPNADPVMLINSLATKYPKLKTYAEDYTQQLQKEVEGAKASPQHALFQDQFRAVQSRVEKAEIARRNTEGNRNTFLQTPYGSMAYEQQLNRVAPVEGGGLVLPAGDAGGNRFDEPRDENPFTLGTVAPPRVMSAPVDSGMGLTLPTGPYLNSRNRTGALSSPLPPPPVPVPFSLRFSPETFTAPPVEQNQFVIP